MMYEVCVANHVVGRYADHASAEVALEALRHSFYALVHPVDCMGIRKVEA